MKDAIASAIAAACQKLGLPETDFVVDYPTDKNAGADYFSNVALVLAKQVGKNPREVAEQITASLEEIDQVDSVEIAGPGFLNFVLNRNYFKNTLDAALVAGDEWGKNNAWQEKVVIVEYTDPNPFKEFHIGHLFTNAVGESIARLFMMNGADTKRVNYQGDVGMHVANAVWGMMNGKYPSHAEEWPPAMLGMAYAYGASEYKSGKNPEVVEEAKRINKVILIILLAV